MNNKIYFYQNNPCTIINKINDEFCEVAISHKYGSEMELMCQGCAVGDSDNKLSCTCSEHEWIVEQLQDEEHLSLVIVRSIYLREDPVEYFDILSLKKIKEEERVKINDIKLIHKEWEDSIKEKKLSVDALTKESEAICLHIESAKLKEVRLIESIESLSEELKTVNVKIKSTDDVISINDYESLERDSEKLRALEAGGVDNWTWYDESMKNAGL